MAGLSGQVAFVSGGSVGIGRQIALTLAELGADIGFTWHSHPPDALEAEVNALGRRTLAIEVDVTSSVAVTSAVDKVAVELGPVQVLVANAGGLLRRVPLATMSDDHWHAVLDTNLTSAFYLVRASLPHMADGARIVLVSSLAAYTGGGAGAGAYAAAKAGMLGLARALAKELAPRGIAVNAVCPGFIEGTPFHSTFTTPEDQKATIAGLPARRGGNPHDVASLVAYLATGATNFLTGQAITVSGGQELV